MSANLVERDTAVAPLLIERPNGWWEFHGRTVEEHLECWNTIKSEVERDYWMLASIAASLTTRYNEKTVSNFAYEVRLSARRIWEMAATYKAFEKCERSQILSFHHHTLAAKAPEPQRAIRKAEDKEWSTRQLDNYIQTGLEPGESVKINSTAVIAAVRSKDIEPIDDLKAVGDEAMIDHLQEALQTIGALKLKCPRAKFVADVYAGWEEELSEHLEQLTLESIKEKVVGAWKSGRREERQIAKFTGVPESEIHGIMRAYERDGIFEKIKRRKTTMAKGSPPWIWHLKGEPVGSDYHSN